MAILKSKEINRGQDTVNYHRIRYTPTLKNEPGVQSVAVRTDEYKSAQARQDDLGPIGEGTCYFVQMSRSELLNSNTNILALSYSKLMELPEFESGTEI